MTATVATSVSASFNLALLYMEKCNIVTFYLSNEDKNKISHSTTPYGTDLEACNAELSLIQTSHSTKHKILDEKTVEAWAEFDKQLAPLMFFTLGAVTGAGMAKLIGFWSLSIPLIVVLELAAETLLLRDALLEEKKRAYTSIVNLTDNEMTSNCIHPPVSPSSVTHYQDINNGSIPY